MEGGVFGDVVEGAGAHGEHIVAFADGGGDAGARLFVGDGFALFQHKQARLDARGAKGREHGKGVFLRVQIAQHHHIFALHAGKKGGKAPFLLILGMNAELFRQFADICHVFHT